MKRNGFTMVELIFVIIIIGILSVAAIPKFGDIKDRAKVATEYSTLSGLDGAIEAAIAFQQDDHNNMAVAWHGLASNGVSITHSLANTGKDVLGKILKKNEAFRVVAILDLDAIGDTATTGVLNDVIFIEGPASDHISGVKEQEPAGDTNGKPDKNDVWVFNTSPVEIAISGTSVTGINILSGELKLLDAKEALAYATAGKVDILYATVAAPATLITAQATTTLP